MHVLVHADGGTEYARADVRKSRQIQQTLHRAIFAIRAVQHGENDVHMQRVRTRCADRHQRRHIGIRREHHALACFQNFREHLVRGSSGEPLAPFGDPDGHGFVFFLVQRLNYRRR